MFGRERGEPIIAAILDAWGVKADVNVKKSDGSTLRITTGATSSYVQLMGLPVSLANPLSDTYLFPSYNNRTLYAQLRFGVP